MSARKGIKVQRKGYVWSERDRRGPADVAANIRIDKRRIIVKPNEFGFRLKAPLLGGVPRGPIHVSRAVTQVLTGAIPEAGGPGPGAPGGGTCPANVTKLSGATILTNPKIALMWWSTYFWDQHQIERSYYQKAVATFCNDPSFWARLNEYGITGGSYGGQIDLTRFGGSATQSEQAIRQALSFRFGNVSGGADSSTIYIVMLPNAVTSDYDTSNSFVGHHQTYKYNGQNIWYSVVEYNTDTRQTLSVITHEIYEAATDPDVSTGYFDHAKGGETEVGDLCSGQTMMLDGYTVQLVWSQNNCACK